MRPPRPAARRGAARACTALLVLGASGAWLVPPAAAEPILPELPPAVDAAILVEQPADVPAEPADVPAEPAAVPPEAAEPEAAVPPEPVEDAAAPDDPEPAGPDVPAELPAAASPTAVSAPAPNTSPVAQADRVSLVQGRRVAVDLLANDTDPDGDVLSLVGATSAAHGTLSVEGPVATYTPDDGFVGVDTFTYVVGDGRGATASALVTLTVRAVLPAAAPAKVPPARRVVQARPPAPTAAVPVVGPVVAPVAAPARPRTGAAVPQRAQPPMGPFAEERQPVGGTAPTRPATLPFTGGPLQVLLPSGLALLVAGAGLARAGRRRPGVA